MRALLDKIYSPPPPADEPEEAREFVYFMQLPTDLIGYIARQFCTDPVRLGGLRQSCKRLRALIPRTHVFLLWRTHLHLVREGIKHEPGDASCQMRFDCAVREDEFKVVPTCCCSEPIRIGDFRNKKRFKKK
jgi:hypothetical protein